MTQKTDTDKLYEMLIEVRRIRKELVALTEAARVISDAIEKLLEERIPRVQEAGSIPEDITLETLHTFE
jgi:hypothetical protein